MVRVWGRAIQCSMTAKGCDNVASTRGWGEGESGEALPGVTFVSKILFRPKYAGIIYQY